MAEKISGVWITGGSSGIGKAAAKEFARTGSRVFVSARRTRELERLNEELEKEKLSAVIFPCNVASSANVDQTLKKINALQKIDCLINNAGITSFKTAEDNSVQEINDVINTNLLGSIYTIRLILPYFRLPKKYSLTVLLILPQKWVYLVIQMCSVKKSESIT